jgi:hypothetical protein
MQQDGQEIQSSGGRSNARRCALDLLSLKPADRWEFTLPEAIKAIQRIPITIRNLHNCSPRKILPAYQSGAEAHSLMDRVEYVCLKLCAPDLHGPRRTKKWVWKGQIPRL